MPSDDEIIRSYERELGDTHVDGLDDLADLRPPSNRKFWLVMCAMGVACVFVLVEIFANLGIKESIAHAQSSLRDGQAIAEAIQHDDGMLTTADAAGMASETDALTFVGPDEPSTDLDELSVAAGTTEWAAAVQVRPGACFYLHIDGDTVTYGAGTICTGRAGLEAVDDRW
jgi:hypothetical protein